MTDITRLGLEGYAHASTEGAPGAPLMMTFHGTGGNEHQFHALGSELVSGAHVISPRGDVDEGGHARFFRRRAEGVYDMDDLDRATAKLAGFVEQAREATKAVRTIGLGYSNGANILASVLFVRPDLFDEVVLMHPLIPFEPAPQPGLLGKRVLITAGRRDPIGPAVQSDALGHWLTGQGADVTIEWHDGGHELRANEISATQAFLDQS